MSRIKKKSNQTNSSAITPTSSKTKVQTGNTSKSVTTLNLNKKDTTSPDDQATITEQQHQMIDELLQRVNTLEGKFFELEGWILVTQRVKSHLENSNILDLRVLWPMTSRNLAWKMTRMFFIILLPHWKKKLVLTKISLPTTLTRHTQSAV